MTTGIRLVLAALLVTAFCSCSAQKDGEGRKISTVRNSDYRTPAYARPPHVNPDVHLSANFKPNKVTYSRGSSNYPYIAITFDDGPHRTNTPRLLDILRARNIKATFYVIGRSVDNYPHIARRIVAEGHEIGNHTYTHSYLTKLSDAGVRRELTRTRDSIVRATGVAPRTMRPPYGALYQRQRVMIKNEFGYPTIMWSVDPKDWQQPGVSVVTSRILSNTRNGSIVLAHDLHASTVDAMPGALDGLLAKGFRFVTVSQLLANSGGAQ